METNHDQTAEEVYRLVKENNKMLHGMRRRAFFGGIFKLVFWIALIVAPIWFYQTYLSPVVGSMLKSMNQVGDAAQTHNCNLKNFKIYCRNSNRRFRQYFKRRSKRFAPRRVGYDIIH